MKYPNTRVGTSAIEKRPQEARLAANGSETARYGLEITPERLRQVEEGEAFIRSLGVTGDLRVRHHGTRASVEVGQGEMDELRSQWDRVGHHFAGLGFEEVELDPRGYQRGRLLALAPEGAT